MEVINEKQLLEEIMNHLDGNTSALLAQEKKEATEQIAWEEFIQSITENIDWKPAVSALLRLHADLYLAQEEHGLPFDALDLVGDIREVLIKLREYDDNIEVIDE